MISTYDRRTRTTGPPNARVVVRHVALLLGVALISGCGEGLSTADPVDPAIAVQALKTTLDTWKSGGTAADLRQRDPEIVAQDMSWVQGVRLLDYQVLDDQKAVDANLYCNVRLRLSNASGKPTEKSVVYIVGTDPVLTVFRQMP